MREIKLIIRRRKCKIPRWKVRAAVQKLFREEAAEKSDEAEQPEKVKTKPKGK